MTDFPRRAIAVTALMAALVGTCIEASPASAKEPAAQPNSKTSSPEVFLTDFLGLWEDSIYTHGAGPLFSWLHWPFFPPVHKPPVGHHPYPPGPPTWVPPVTPPPHPVPPPHPTPTPPHSTPPPPKPPKH